MTQPVAGLFLNRAKTPFYQYFLALILYALLTEVLGQKYPGQVPMTPFEHMLNDQEIASVLTYVRNSFGNKATPVETEDVARVRKEVKDFVGLYSPDALLKEHPLI